MNKNELVWRTLADESLRGRREWPDQRSISARADVPISTVHQAIKRLTAIGAISTRHRGGLTVKSPEKLLTYYSARRNFASELVCRTSLDGVQLLLNENQSDWSLGGADAAVHWLGDVNNIADKGQRLVYVDQDLAARTLPSGDDAIVLTRDAVARRTWRDGYSSRAQTYADLFALPGWQASEFRRALHEKFFPGPDWDQTNAVDA